MSRRALDELRRPGDRHRVAAQRDLHAAEARQLDEVAVVDAGQGEQVRAFGGQLLRDRVSSLTRARPPRVMCRSAQVRRRHRRRRALEQRARRGRLRETRSRRAATSRRRAASRCDRTRRRCRRAAAHRRAAPRAGSRTAPAPSPRRCRAARRCATARAGSLMRMLPPPSSVPLSTRSYACARALHGSVSSSATSSGCGAVNGWCTARERAGLRVALEHREVGHPHERVHVGRHEVHALRHLLPHAVERRARDRGPAPATNSPRSPSASPSSSRRALGEELRRRPLELAVHALEPQQPARARALRDRLELVDLLARQRRAAGHADAAHAPARRRAPCFVTANSDAAEDVAHVDDLEPVAQVGPVDAVALHRLGVRHPRNRRRHVAARPPPTARRSAPRRAR